MTGPDYDEDGPEEFRPVPHPDDRLWRHPSEVAAMQAAHANAETLKVPAVQIPEPRTMRPYRGMLITAGVVLVGAAALTLGVVSSRGSVNDAQTASEIAGITPASSGGAADEDTAPPLGIANLETTEAADVSADGEEQLALRLKDEVADSLPRIQAATPSGMREGSGLFVTDDGHIATSAGLIEDADYVLAWTDDGQRWKASVIASDPISDVAVVQIDSENWPAMSFGTGTGLRAGQYALALDHDDQTISIGEVTSVDEPYIGVAQPAAVPGSAIVDDRGEVIAIVTNDGTNAHATPAWMLEQVTVDLIADGTTTHSWLGVIIERDARRVAPPSGSASSDEGVLISDVAADSPAHEAELRAGDLIDSINGMAVADAATLHRQVQAIEPGQDAVLTINRDGSRRIVIATITELPR